MKNKIGYSIVAVLLVASIAGCKKESTSTPQTPNSQTSNTSSVLSSERSLLAQQSVVNLGSAATFSILSKTGITDVYKSSVAGDIGTSPITGAAIHLICAEVNGTIYTVDAAGPAPCSISNASKLTTAVGDMQTAYTDAAGRVNPNFLNLGAGNIGGLTLAPGLYKWTSALTIPSDIAISGGPNDVWIFQVAGTLNMSSAVRITLSGGARASNIFWQVGGGVTLGTTSHFEGVILAQTAINMLTGATINGRLLGQTAVTLEQNTVVPPINLPYIPPYSIRPSH